MLLDKIQQVLFTTLDFTVLEELVQKLKVKRASQLDDYKLIWQKKALIFPTKYAWHVLYAWLHLKTVYCKASSHSK